MHKMNIENVRNYVTANGYGVFEITGIDFPDFLGEVRISMGILYASENIGRPEWIAAIVSALEQVQHGDAGNFYEDYERKNPNNMYYMCPSPFDPDGKSLDCCIMCNRSCYFGEPITTVYFSFER